MGNPKMKIFFIQIILSSFSIVILVGCSAQVDESNGSKLRNIQIKGLNSSQPIVSCDSIIFNAYTNSYSDNSGKSFSGQCRSFYENGAVKKEAVYENGGQVILIERCENGELRRYRITDSLHYSWWCNGQPRMESYQTKEDLDHGVFRSWYENGKIQSEKLFKNNRLAGPYKKWHENGELWKNYTVYDIYSDGIWKNKYEGEFVIYFKNGQIKEVGNYENGEKVGTWKKYNENGDVISSEDHLDN